jgi:serine/threonine protein kinase
MKPMLFGKYCLLERISVGGMAEVFRAKPFDAPDFRGYLALKRILPHLAEDDEFIKMFVDEAKLTVQLTHPNIVRIYELGRFQHSYYILMEFISGQDLLALQKTMRRRRQIIPTDQSMFIARELARGLHYAHHKRDADGNPLNIIHRDVSPQNVLIDYRGNVKLIDFGIAKAAVQSTRTQVGVLKGKMGYMSPEQVRGEDIDYRSDVFSIGTVLWEMLTNRRLFHADNEFETMQRVRDAQAEPPSAKNPDVPAEVDDIVMAALTVDPENRYKSAAAFADAIDAWLQKSAFDKDELSVWMRTVYADALDEEREKREAFARIRTPDDVRRILKESLEETAPDENDTEERTGLGQGDTDADDVDVVEDDAIVEMSEPQDDGELYEKTEIWDADILPDEGQDLSEFAAQHTTVQAGGFDVALLAEDERADLETLDEERPVNVPPMPRPASTPGGRGEPAPERARTNSDPGPTPPRQMRTVGADNYASEGTHPGPSNTSGRMPTWFLAVAAICILLAVAGLGSVVGLLLLEDEAAAPAPGAMVVNVTPPTDFELLVDGKAAGNQSPVTLEELSAGEHLVEVRREGYQPFSQSVVVRGGEVSTTSVALEPAAPQTGTIVLKLPETEELAVYVDGERQLVESDAPAYELSAGMHLFEVIAPASRPWTLNTDVEASVRREEVVELRPLHRSLEIRANAAASVYFDRKRVGRGIVTVEEIDPFELHNLRIVVRAQGISTWRSYLGWPQIGKEELVVDFDRPLPPDYKRREFGYLRVSTGDDWWAVSIDDVDTGLVTPFEEGVKLPVTAGSHRVTLRRGETEHERDIEIEAGETLELEEELTFQFESNEEG